VNTHPNSAVEILQLLLRCGMVCQEELNVVLEMMPARFRQPGPVMQEPAAQEPGLAAAPRLQAPKPQPRQKTLIPDFDARV